MKNTFYVFDGMYTVAEFGGHLDLKAKYVYANGMLLARYDASPADSHYYHHDGLGSTMGLTNESGSVEQSYFYDEFGNSLGSWGNVSNHYFYTGQEYDADVSGAEQYNLRARYYKTGIGRFTSEDPDMQVGLQRGTGCVGCGGRMNSLNNLAITMNINVYLYVFNNPINNIDPLGLKTIKRCTPNEVAEEMSLITTAFKKCCRFTWPWEIDCATKTREILFCMEPLLISKLECCYFDYVILSIVPFHVGVGVGCFDCNGKLYTKEWEPWSCREWPK